MTTKKAMKPVPGGRREQPKPIFSKFTKVFLAGAGIAVLTMGYLGKERDKAQAAKAWKALTPQQQAAIAEYDREKAQQAQVLATPAPPALPEGQHYIVKDYIGCASKDYEKQLIGFAVDGDKVAFNKARNTGFELGVCTRLSVGDVVTIEDTAIFDGLIKVRPRGELSGYWTSMDVVKIK